MLQSLEYLTGESPDASVIWLHGLGADGYDFYDIIPMLELPKTAAIRFIFPHAPLLSVTLNGGQKMHAWYDIIGIGEQYSVDLEGVEKSRHQILEIIEQEKSKGIPVERIILAGFSQGGVVALHTALHMPEKIAGVLGLSCYLASPLTKEHVAPFTLNIMMMHGRDDNVVSIEYGKKSCATITNAGYKVVWKEYSMPHSVCAPQLLTIGQWISKILGNQLKEK